MTDHRAELALGTAQLGMNYGRTNQSGQPDSHEVKLIIDTALKNGVRLIDTAQAYGVAEDATGKVLATHERDDFAITTKLHPNIGETLNDIGFIKNAIDASFKHLNVDRIDNFLLHRWEQKKALGGQLWKVLLEYKKEGKIGRLGFSMAFELDEVKEALTVPEVEFIQVPLNILDWRWQESGLDKALLERPSIHLQARSILLQGVLVNDASYWPHMGQNTTEVIEWLNDTASDMGLSNRLELCFAYAKSLPWVNSIVVGVENAGQLRHNIQLYNKKILQADEIDRIVTSRPKVPVELLNPALWV